MKKIKCEICGVKKGYYSEKENTKPPLKFFKFKGVVNLCAECLPLTPQAENQTIRILLSNCY